MVDCRTAEGITVGLIDSLISVCRVLAPRLDVEKSSAVTEALRDLRADEDVARVCSGRSISGEMTKR